MMARLLARLMQDEHGSTTLEFSIIAALVSVAVVAAVSATGDSLAGMFGILQTELARAISG